MIVFRISALVLSTLCSLSLIALLVELVRYGTLDFNLVALALILFFAMGALIYGAVALFTPKDAPMRKRVAILFNFDFGPQP